MQLNPTLLPKPVRNLSVELRVETCACAELAVSVCVRLCGWVAGWLAGWKMRDPGCVGMLYGKVCQPVVLQVIADISSFMHLIADLHCL